MTEPTSRDKLEQLQAARTKVMDEGRPEAVAKRRAFDMGTARERIEQFVDADSFREMGALVEPERSNELSRDLIAPADGAITGTAKVDGREVCIFGQDFTVHGGSIGSVADNKVGRLIQRSVVRGLPMVMMLEGGGHRIQDGMNAAHFAAASPVFNNMCKLSGWVPNVVAMMGQGFAGPTAYASLADFVVMLRGKSTMGIAGPALVKAGMGIDISKEDLGGAKRQAEEQGIADLAVDTEEECLEAVRKFLSYLPQNSAQPLPITACDDPIDRRDDKLLDLVTASPRKVYDMRKVIKIIADVDSTFELKPDYARNIITCFARLDGRPVGFFANQPLRKGGILDTPACEKVAHFIAMCDAFGLPLVSLIDIPGIAIGPDAEDTGLGQRSGRLFFEMGVATVPRVSVVLRKGYGGGYYAMGGGRAFDADAAFAWPTAEICAMSIEGAVDVAYKKYYMAADDPDAARTGMIERIKAQTGAMDAARDFGIDDVIDPRDTRKILIETFASCPARRPDMGPPRVRPISPI
ncbi:MAG: acyl-CoA carboxylase [Rhodospirillaceae bacterium]|jgi:acetyl-CoA carboxylase carboxyltransferase component|nr:acyl-CoA carboxylase [Rhodospirillaceae bacterium]